jgi:hypothetical protein
VAKYPRPLRGVLPTSDLPPCSRLGSVNEDEEVLGLPRLVLPVGTKREFLFRFFDIVLS